jgi:hypothetical protein
MKKILAIAAFALACSPLAAMAQAFPAKPIKIIVPFVAGTPEEFGQFMKAEIDRWTLAVERGGIKTE